MRGEWIFIEYTGNKMRQVFESEIGFPGFAIEAKGKHSCSSMWKYLRMLDVVNTVI